MLFFRNFFFLLINDSSTSLAKVHKALLKIKTTVAAEGLNVLIEMSRHFCGLSSPPLKNII